MIYRHFQPSLRLFFMGLTGLLGLVIMVSSLLPTEPNTSITQMDKIMHVLAYLSLGAATLPAFPKIKPILVWLGLTLFGLLIEGLQGVMSIGRTTDILDGLANASGALLAILGWFVLSWLVRKFIS